MSDTPPTDRGDKPHPIPIEVEMRQSYLDYAMSVIIGRALPDVRDGLKPVHRRVLYAMHADKLSHDRPYRKSARVVGQVLGRFHPHGDAAVYDTLVRMAQDFSLRYPLIDGQGNFGSIDGDPPAAMRYTEVRMQRVAGEMLADIEKETVDWVANYDGSEEEPSVLPAGLPNLLVNGSSGIAVGMATNIPPHNLGEVIDAVVLLVENPEASIDDLMQVIPGPDFPTAGFIYGREGIRQAYRTGRGRVIMRAHAEIETHEKSGKDRILVTEIPYQVNKTLLIERIADLVRDGKMSDIADLRDESNREGIRLVIELKKGAVAQVVLNNLYAHTPMQETFGVNMLAIHQSQPRTMNLKQVLQAFIEHRREVVVRRTRYLLRKAEERAHILEGLKIALDNLDAVIELIRKSKTPPEAKEGLCSRFQLSELQAQAILDMRLQRLTGLERQKILDEYEEVLKEIARLKEILGSETLVLGIIVDELKEVRAKYADERRTRIIDESVELTVEDMIAEEDMVITCSRSGYIKRNPVSIYRSQQRGGKGRIGMRTRDEDFVEQLFIASTHAYILFFTNLGRVHWLKVHEIPEVGAAGKGKAIKNWVRLRDGERVVSMETVKDFDEDRFLLFVSRRGTVKRTVLSAYSRPRAGGIQAVGVAEGDDLLAVRIAEPGNEVLVATRGGYAVRFRLDQVRAMGRTAVGVRGINLREGDEVVGVELLQAGGLLLTVTENGYGKRTSADDYRITARGGKGIINIRVTERNGPAVNVMETAEDDQIFVITQSGMILRMKTEGISKFGRATQGVRLMTLGEGDRVVAVARVPREERTDEAELPEVSDETGDEPPLDVQLPTEDDDHE
ncbi:MAG: DNA gyrase subunit A [Acidobacteriota bacterium]|jgi:DNA gyrase subunit A